jgi:haloacid dehalogenase-like hydrolase
MRSPPPNSNAVRAVLFIDVDGTLVPGVSSAGFLAARLGHADQVAEAEAAWDAGLVTARQVEELDARGWAGTAEAQVREWLAELPLVDGIGEVIRWCRDHDVVPVLATLAWRPVGSYLCETFGFYDCCGPALEVRDGIFTGVALGSCDEYGKRERRPRRPCPRSRAGRQQRPQRCYPGAGTVARRRRSCPCVRRGFRPSCGTHPDAARGGYAARLA